MTISSKMFVLLVSTMVVGVCLDVPSMAIGLELKPYCGFPGKPYRAKIMPEEKLVFLEGESVMYQCADYWAPPQSKKCVNGQWVGPVVRCGDFVSDLLMRDSRLVDVATGEEKFHYTNMNITSTDWKYPNSFTSNRFRKARLRALDDHPYRWTFNFSKPAVKLYCKLNFNFINFSLQSEEFKKEFRFNLNISISPHRICKLEYQSYNPWRQEGNRIDSYFICEANSLQALQAELADPPNALEIRTKASHKLTHELIAVFFGRVYGTDKEPLCGEPELEYGQAYRPNQEFRDYMIDCANRHEWQDMNPPGVKSFNYVNRCFGDMRWNGTRPHCQPKQSCPMSKVNQEYRTGMYNTTHHDNLVIDSISKFYFEQEEDTVYATAGTEIIYTCQSEDYVLIGKDTRVCKENFKWSGTEPVCKFIKSSNELIESSNYLFLIIICMSVFLVLILIVSCILFAVFTRRQKLRRRRKLAKQQNEMNQLYEQANIYDNIELTLDDKDERVYEMYERIDGEPADNFKANKLLADELRYSEPNQYTTYYLNNDDDSYIRMLEHSPARPVSSIESHAVAMRHHPDHARRHPEPSYLELMNK